MLMFWLFAALLTIGACLAVLSPFLGRSGGYAASGYDLEVYRDQLAELDRDFSRGMISSTEAEEARAEIGRRILRAADDTGPKGISPKSGRAAKVAATIAVLAIPVVALGAYLLIGSPQMPDQALETRLAANPADNTIEELVARAERHLAANPGDGRGWDVLAPIYLRVGRAGDAVTAFENAIRLDGTSAAREAGLGEATYQVAGGVVTTDAQAAFQRALAIDPTDGKSRFYLALGQAQEGKVADASASWREMIADLPAGSPWRVAAGEAIARAQDETPVAETGPGADDVKAAAEMSDEDRAAMVEGMVAQLDERLRDNPADPAGWRRLIRSYAVLGKTGEARDALARGIAGLGPDTREADELKTFAATHGIAEAASE